MCETRQAIRLERAWPVVGKAESTGEWGVTKLGGCSWGCVLGLLSCPWRVIGGSTVI